MIVTFVFTLLRKGVSLLFRFNSIATVKRKEKAEPALDYVCLILPYVPVLPDLTLFLHFIFASRWLDVGDSTKCKVDEDLSVETVETPPNSCSQKV